MTCVIDMLNTLVLAWGKAQWIERLSVWIFGIKKSPYDPNKYSDRTKQLKIDYCATIADIPQDKLIFLDEMGAGLNLSPLYGRAPSNLRVYDEAPVARGQRISMVGAMTSSGMKTALNFEGSMTGLVFLYFLKHFLCPLLTKDDYVVMDNASFTK